MQAKVEGFVVAFLASLVSSTAPTRRVQVHTKVNLRQIHLISYAPTLWP
jgi:hypothetical protein